MVQKHISRLQSWFYNKQGTITAFSGGIDSTLVLFLSKKFLGKNAIGCISISPSLKRQDYRFAIEFCENNDIALEVVETKELLDENYFSNPNNRCYFCKSHLYKTLDIIGAKYSGYTILNGTNTDDLGDYRPGLQAAKEHSILSPLLDCEIDKAAVREIAKSFSLPNWEKPASPCLSSRVPYGDLITFDKLKQIENAELILNEYGYVDVRVRHFNKEARIEVPDGQILQLKHDFEAINSRIMQLGFTRCIIDEEGLVSGKLNRAIAH